MNWKLLGWALLTVTTNAAALEPWAPTDAEMASLPPFCKVKMRAASSSPEYKMWEGILGKDFIHTHHFCAGLNFINRYYRSRTKQDRIFNLNNALDSMNYMVEHASPGYSLMPEVYLNRGLAYSLMKRQGEAVADMNKAIELDPRQAKAYEVLADYYAGAGQKKKALQTVTEGLRNNPGTKSLQRRYKELGGKEPYPEPIRPVDAGSPANPAGESAPPDTARAAPPLEPTVSPTKIGTPENPYCRFCPD